jgi:hypothetical protein
MRGGASGLCDAARLAEDILLSASFPQCLSSAPIAIGLPATMRTPGRRGRFAADVAPRDLQPLTDAAGRHARLGILGTLDPQSPLRSLLYRRRGGQLG